MAFEQKDMDGALFKNDRKESDKHPDYKGSATIGGRKMWLSAWLNTTQSGQKYMKLSFQWADQQQADVPVPEVAVPAATTAAEDDIPFAVDDFPLDGVDLFHAHANR